MLQVILKLSRSTAASFLLTALLISAVMADDTEVFTQSSSSVNPNVLIILDTSKSMTETVVTDSLMRSRLNILKDALDTILDASADVNMGIMRFTNPGGAILFPVADVDALACDIEGNCGGGSGGQLVTTPIQTGADDTEAFIIASNFASSSSTTLARAPGLTQYERQIGLVFRNVAVPQGATINAAELVFHAGTSTTTSVETTYQIRIEQDPTPDDLPDGSQGGTAMATRWASGSGPDWSVPSTEEWSTTQAVTSPSITTNIQSLINDSGWCGGNDIAVFIKIDAGSDLRELISFNANDAFEPSLDITYDRSGATGCQEIERVFYGVNEPDDAEEYVSSSNASEANGYVHSSDGSLNTPRDEGRNTNSILGFRFQNVTIPQGTDIVSSDLRLVTSFDALPVDEQAIDPNYGIECVIIDPSACPSKGTSAASVIIKGENTDNSAGFINASIATISNRSTTSSSVTWDLPNQTVGGESHVSPDLESVVEAVVSRSGWASGNSLSLILSPNVTTGNRIYSSVSAAVRPRLTVRFKGTNDPETTTVRQRLKQIVSNINSDNLNEGTPIVETFYEAQQYWSGGPVGFGKTRNSETEEGTPAIADEKRFFRVSHPASYTGGTLTQPAGCSADDLNNIACANELISGSPAYISPIAHQCQQSYNVLITDGAPTGINNSQADIQALVGGGNACTGSGGGVCGSQLLSYMATTDQSSSETGMQVVRTFTVGFDFSSTYLSGLAAAGLGSYFAESEADALVDVFEQIIGGVATTGAAFAGAGISVNQFSRLSHNEDLYFSLFRPDDRPQWLGNLKKYRVDSATGEIADANGNEAMDASTGFFRATSKSYWSDSVDGNEVTLGGASGELSLTGRKVYSRISSDALSDASNTISENNSTITIAALGADDAADRSDILRWARGIDVNDADSDTSTSDIRPYIGAPLHGEPVVISYGENDESIFVGTNDGLLHAFDADDGTEHFSYLPNGLLSKLKILKENQIGDSIPYGVDGQITSWVVDGNNNGVISGAADRAYLYFGLRRGGNDYYALDVTNRSAPAHMWRISGGVGDYTEIGQSWSQPIITKILIGTETKDVLIFGAGYDTSQDTATTKSADGQGRAIYIVDAETGDKLWAGGSASAAGMTQTFTGMDYSIPSKLSVLDTSADGLADRIYFGDMGGQVWRFDIKNGQPASTLVTGHIMASVSGTTAANNRRFFYAPDVSLNNNRLTLSIGSGWRSHPLDDVVNDRLYIIRDNNVSNIPSTYPATLTESTLYDATDNLIGKGTESSSANLNAATTKGFYIQLEDDGEKALSQARTVNNQVLFTTYEPSASAISCSAGSGTSRIYAFSVDTGAPVIDVDGDLSIAPDTDDRRLSLASQVIPPAPTVLFPDGGDPVVLVGGEKVLDDLDFGPLGQRTFWIEGE
ncbi:PilC/PilY family type IV pilus protein [Pelagibaculum spongiae]|uniref:PilY1 beta-propeller domain-containing protein n=1 Tax=Pelagibaculum spongiae TaxID=2080658 RepID=A0A2V1GWR9_9GAMM|nr:PilC/PilY family type IV pilus protein [Pelagibaculum spongiae]PVZ70450.1 hypothetical protein DC094_07640 [Pelagibaculum spongiae]